MGSVSRGVFTLVFSGMTLVMLAQSLSDIAIEQSLLDYADTHQKSLLYDADIFSNISVEGKSVIEIQRINEALEQYDIYLKETETQIYVYRKLLLGSKVVSEESGEALINATIVDLSHGGFSYTDVDGNFILSVHQEDYELQISYVGYQDTILLPASPLGSRIALAIDKNLPTLTISDVLYSEQDILANPFAKSAEQIIRNNNAISAVGGEPDLYQGLYRYAGVAGGVDGIGGVHVRGGKADQNLSLVNGVPSYNTSHALGVYAAINPLTIHHTRFYKQGVSDADFGRLSSVLDVQLKKPDMRDLKVTGQISTVASSARLSTPLLKDKWAVSISGRRTHLDYFIKDRSRANKSDKLEDGELDYAFSDVSIQSILKLDDRNQIQFLYQRAVDDFFDFGFTDLSDEFSIYFVDEEQSLSWKNELLSLSWKAQIGNRSYLDVSLYQSSYDYDSYNYNYLFDEEAFVDESYFTSFQSQVKNRGAKINFQSEQSSNRFSIQYGLALRDYLPGFITVDEFDYNEERGIGDGEVDDFEELFGSPDYRNLEHQISVSDRWQVMDRLELGVTANAFQGSTESFFDEESMPYYDWGGRVSMKYGLTPTMSAEATVSRSIQTEHLLSSGDVGFPSDIWIPSTKLISPSYSHVGEIGLRSLIGSAELKIATYYKEQGGLLFYDNITSLPSLFEFNTSFWEEEVIQGDATSYGLELETRAKLDDRLSFFGSYTYAKTSYRFDDINQGSEFPFGFDIPHKINLAASYSLADDWRLSVDWIFASGRPITLYDITGNFSVIDNLGGYDTEQISDINAQRLASQYKLSLSISKIWISKNYSQSLSLGIHNIYNRENELFRYQSENQEIRRGGFPLSPIFRYRVSI